jgi:hypothetical protein
MAGLSLTLVSLASQPGWAQTTVHKAPSETVSFDITGVWDDLFDEDVWERRSGLRVGDFTGLPLNEAGRLASASWNPGWFAIPEEQCRPHTAIYGMRANATMYIEKKVDPVSLRLIAYHVFVSGPGKDRTVWMDGRPHPPEYAEHTWSGFSTGAWEGNQLVVKTTHVKNGYHQRNGPPHSDRAITTEYFTRLGDTLLLTSFIEDPAYLSEPLVRTTNWTLAQSPDTTAGPEGGCGPFNVVDESIGRSKYAVPHFLPGEYEQAREYQAAFGIPEEAAFGGAETLYPEYIPKLNALRESFLKRLSEARPPALLPKPGEPGFVGNWVLNRGKSTFDVAWRRVGVDARDGSAPDRRVMRIEATSGGGITHVTDTVIVANDTGFHRVEYEAKFDGRDYSAKGGAVETYALKLDDPLTLERVGKIKGSVVQTDTWKLSRDGNTLTITSKGNVEGAAFSNVQVFERTE